MSNTIDEVTFRKQAGFALESDRVRVIVLPRVSGKIASLVDKSTGQELLVSEPERDSVVPAYGAAWATSDMSGWEDCLPTVAASTYPEWPWQGTYLPEHGEVWALPWEVRAEEGAIRLTVHGVRLPYEFEKRIVLEGSCVRVRHRLFNPSAFPIRYIWATHPLFRVRPGTRIELPKETRVRVDWSRDGRLGNYLDEHVWPRTRDAQGAEVHLDVIGGPGLGLADKLYTSALREGWCGLHDPASGQSIGFRFDPRQLPYVGVWINQGGWPLEGPAGYHVALEPTCGYPDLLSVAYARGTAATVGPGEQSEWEVECHIGRADSVRSLLGLAPE